MLNVWQVGYDGWLLFMVYYYERKKNLNIFMPPIPHAHTHTLAHKVFK